jgi:hypothetical protein
MKNSMNVLFAIIMIVTISACGNNNHKTSGNTSSQDQQQITTYENQIAELTQQNIAYHQADSLRIAETVMATELEDTLSRINISPLGIIALWDGKKVHNLAKNMKYDDALDGSFRYAVLDLFKESGYTFLRKSFITAPAIWQNVFVAETSRIAWLKKKLELPAINTDILPYLKDEYSPEGFQQKYISYFKNFYAIHSSSTTDGVWYHPQWQSFEDGFFKAFPTAFGGDHSKFGRAYKLWRTSYSIPIPAKKKLAKIIETYNSL